MADSEVKVLAQQPVKVNLAGVEFDIYPPTTYRLEQILTCAKAAREEIKDSETPLPVKYDVMRLICKTKDVFVNGQLVEGEIPEPLKSDEFWQQQVQTAEIAGLFEVFVSLIDIDKLLKNAIALMGR